MPYLYKRPGFKNYYIGLTSREKRLLGIKNYSTGTSNERHAKKILVTVKKELRLLAGNPLPKALKQNITIRDAFELIKEDRKNTLGSYSGKTIKGYDESIKKLIATCGDKLIGDYNRQDYHAFVNNMTLSRNSKAAHTRRIYHIFNWLVKENYLTEHYFKRVQEKQKEVIIKTKEEIDDLLEYSKGTKFYWFVRFQLASAFRLSEVLLTTKSKIEKDIIRVTRKGNVPNYIPIINRMRSLLNEMPISKKERLFPFTSDAIFRFFERYRKYSGTKIVSHDLRKYTLSELANSGVPINFTKDYAGHSDIKTTLKYYVRSDRKKMADEINNKLGAV